MKELTAQKIDKVRAGRLFIFIMLFFCLLPVLINCLALSPLYTVIYNDVAFPDWLVTVLDYAMDLMDLIAFSVPYALIIFSTLLISKKAARSVALVYCGIFLLQIPARIFMNIPVNGSLGSAEQIAVDIGYQLVYFILYSAQLLAVYLFATTDSNRYMRRMAAINERMTKRGRSTRNTEELPYVLPLSGIYSRFNPLQHSALKMGVLVLGIHVITRMINDIAYGMPQSIGEVLIMVVYYLSDIVYGVIAYFLALLVFTAVYDNLKKKAADENSSASADDSDIV